MANGKPMEVEEGATLASLLNTLGLAGRVVVVERNREPVERSAVDGVVLQAGDQLEIVRAVAGG